MRITVQADDLGLSAGATRKIFAVHRDGRLDRAGLLPNGPAFPLAASCLAESGRLDWSVHLNLMEGSSLSSRERIPLLVDRQGCFRRTFLGLWLLYRLAPKKRPQLLAQIERELDAQIRRVKQTLPANELALDSHQHVHLLPFVFRILLRRAKSWDIRRIRIVREPFLLPPADFQGLACLLSAGILKHLLLCLLSRRCLHRLPGSGIGCPDYLVGVLFTGRMSLPVVRRALRRIAARNPGADPTVELVFHPTPLERGELRKWKTSSRNRRFYASANRAREMDTLLSRGFAACLDRATRAIVKPAAAPATWIDYWDSQTIFDPIMERTARHFAERLKTVLPLGRDEVLLDYGCGAGYLIGQLAGSVRELHGTDTSARLISRCRERYANLANVHFHHLDSGRGTELAFLGAKRFSVIICLSVVQYLGGLDEVEKLIRALHRVAAPGARLLIADIPVGSTPLGDALDLVRAAAHEGFLLEAAKFLLQSATTQYARVRAARGLLVLPVPALRQIAGRLALKAEILYEPLTYSRRRVHLLVNYA